MKTALGLASFCLITAIVTAGLVKRDTTDDIQETLGNIGNSIQSEVDNLQNGGVMEEMNKHCVQDSNCLEPFQYCDTDVSKKTLKELTNVNVFRCTFNLWVYVAAAVVVALLFLLLCASCACCPCCCLYSLCRKK